MIRSEKEYQESVQRLEQNKAVIRRQEAELKKQKLPKGGIKRALDPMRSFYEQLAEEIQWYEKIKRKQFDVIPDLNEIGRLLIALRIAGGLTQKDLAKCLAVSEAQVSRDERNEYHGLSLERAQKILGIFGVHVRTQVKIDRPLERETILTQAAS